ncbi:hypothetical protein vBAspALolek_37 [Aeromonas phage vB_AspA_Lolek]|nr:hypothetical protein vBAspALolek_37 [Aeromonas phage vB_AspA_Lolek]
MMAGLLSAVYTLNTVRVRCPDCGQGGANGGPCYCHQCGFAVMMLPIHLGVLMNWAEYAEATN